jgi:hypothetical protein
MEQTAQYDHIGSKYGAYARPAFTLSKPNSTKYGATMLRQTPEVDRYMCDSNLLPNLPRLTSTPSGTKPRMSGRSGRPGSGSSPGTPRKWRPKTPRTMEKRIGEISTTIVS